MTTYTDHNGTSIEASLNTFGGISVRLDTDPDNDEHEAVNAFVPAGDVPAFLLDALGTPMKADDETIANVARQLTVDEALEIVRTHLAIAVVRAGIDEDNAVPADPRDAEIARLRTVLANVASSLTGAADAILQDAGGDPDDCAECGGH